MNMNKKNWLSIILSVLLALIIDLICIAVGSYLNGIFPGKLTQASHVLLICFIVLLIINLIIYATVKRKDKMEKGQDVLDYITKRKEETSADYQLVEKKILRHVRLCFLYAWLMYLLLALNIIFFANGEAVQVSVILSLFFIYSLAVYFYNLFFFIKSEQLPSDYHLKEEQYPELYKFVREVFKEEGIDCAFLLKDSSEPIVSIGQYKRKIEICLGIPSLLLLSKEELRAILIHECAHYHHDDIKDATKRQRYQYMMEMMCNVHIITQVFFYPFCSHFLIESHVYSFMTTIYHEKKADSVVLKKNAEQDMINAIAKLRVYAIYHESLIDQDYLPAFDRIPSDILLKQYDDFLVFYEKHREFLVHSLYHGNAARISTHPALKDRMKDLQVDEIQLAFLKTHPFETEIHRLSERFNQNFVASETQKFNEAHVEYLQFKEKLEKYQGQTDHSSEDKVNMLEECVNHAHYQFALQLADEINREIPFQTRAIFYTGALEILMNLSDKGVTYLKEIINNHPDSEFYTRAYDILGEYFLAVGDEENIEWLRSLSAKAFDQNKTYEELSSLNFTDQLFKAEEDETYQGLLEIIASEDAIFCVASVRKKKNGMELTHVLIDFKDGTEKEESEKIMNKIWAYLDSAPVNRSYVLNEVNLSSLKFLQTFIIYKNERQ